MSDHDDDPIDGLYQAIEKARPLSVRLSPKQRRNAVMSRLQAANEGKGLSRLRGGSGRSNLGPSQYVGARGPKDPTTAGRLNQRSVHFRNAKRISKLPFGTPNGARRRKYAREDLKNMRKLFFNKSTDAVVKAKPKTLYVFRKVENAADIIAWAKAQGFPSTLAESDLHVTIAFSKTPLNWAKLGDDWCAEDPRPNDNGERRYAEAVSWSDGGHKQRRIEGGAREVKALGDKGAVVLAFQSPSLTERWAQFLRIGASWDYAGYTPHITITYKGKGVDLAKVEPYKGPIVLGEEDWNEIKEGAGDNVAEVAADVSKSLDDLNARIAAAESQLKAKEAA